MDNSQIYRAKTRWGASTADMTQYEITIQSTKHSLHKFLLITEFPPDWHTKQPLTQTNHTRWCINPFRSYVGPRLTLWFSCSAPMSEDIRHVFVAPALLSEPVRCFSSCSMDFGQQIAQIVLFLFLSRPSVLMWTGDCALYSRGCVSHPK